MHDYRNYPFEYAEISPKFVHHLGFFQHSHYGNEKRGTFVFRHVICSGRGSLEPNEWEEFFQHQLCRYRGL